MIPGCLFLGLAILAVQGDPTNSTFENFGHFAFPVWFLSWGAAGLAYERNRRLGSALGLFGLVALVTAVFFGNAGALVITVALVLTTHRAVHKHKRAQREQQS